MALRLRAALTVWVTHRAVRLYTFALQPVRPARFFQRAMLAIFTTILAYALITGMIAINGVGGFAVVWANVVAWECLQTEIVMAQCSVWRPGLLAGFGLAIFLVAGLMFALLDGEPN
jgi:hypothetical protein